MSGWSPIYGDAPSVEPAPKERYRSMLAQIRKTMHDSPACVVCHYAFSKPVTYCPSCGARRP